MKIDELKIKNKVYNFGLTDDDIKELEEALISCKGIYGVTYLKKTKKYAFGVKWDSYYNKTEIELNHAEEIKTLPTILISDWRLLFTPTNEEIKHIQILIDHKKNNSRRRYNDDEEKPNHTANHINDIKAQLKIYLFSELARPKHDRRSFDELSREFVMALFWLFDQTEETGNAFMRGDTERGLRQILHVFEEDNKRLSLSFGNYSNSEFKLKLFDSDDERYNYIDKGRWFLGKLYVWDDISKEDLDESFLEKCGSKYRFKVVNANEYNLVKRKFRLKIQKDKEETELKNLMREEAERRLDDINDDTKIVVNGILFKKSGIYYDGQQITGEFGHTDKGYRPINSWAKFYKEKLNYFRNPDKLNFNTIYDNVCELLQEREFDGVLGDIKVKISKVETENVNGDILTRWFVNDVRINKDEVVEVIKRAICFDKSDDFTALLKKVSKCNLKFHDIINNGLRIKFKDHSLSYGSYGHRFSDTKFLKLIIIRHGNRNFIKVNEREYAIKNTGKLLTRSTLNDRQRDTPTFNELMQFFREDYELTDDELIELFSMGIKEYEEAEEKSEQFLKETLELFKVAEVEKDGKNGYLVKGSSGNQYMLTHDLQIFAYPQMRYICVVDKDLGDGFKNDKIVNRIYALANDSRTAKHIYTLKPEEATAE